MASTSARGRSSSRSRNWSGSSHRASADSLGELSSPGEDSSLHVSPAGDDGRGLFQWNGREYAIGGSHVSTTKTTKTTKTATSSDGTVRVLPGSTRVTTIRNSTAYASEIPGFSDVNRITYGGSSSSSRGSQSSRSFGGQSAATGYGQEYYRSTEDELSHDYDEDEEVDPDFARGLQLSPEDQMHPLELHNMGGSAGIESSLYSATLENKRTQPPT